MRRTSIALGLGLGLILASVSGVAATPAKGCPEGPGSAWETFEINAGWTPEDGLPEPGEDAWWDMTLDGLATEGLTAEDAAAMFGLASVMELYQFVIDGLDSLDRNGDDLFCAKPFPEHQNGSPAYFFNAVENNTRLH